MLNTTIIKCGADWTLVADAISLIQPDSMCWIHIGDTVPTADAGIFLNPKEKYVHNSITLVYAKPYTPGPLQVAVVKEV